jgi:hypothetical protein
MPDRVKVRTEITLDYLEHTVACRTIVSLQFLHPKTGGRTPWTGD